MNINFTGSINASSAAASFHKGQELSNEESTEAKDKQRALRQKLVAQKVNADSNKANKAEGKNFLA